MKGVSKQKSLILGGMFWALLLGLMGCHQKEQTYQEKISRTPAKQQAEKVYMLETVDLQITPELSPMVSSLFLTEKALYFHVYENDIYREELTTPLPQKMDITFAEGERLKAFSVDGQENIVCIVQNEEGTYSVKSFSQAGKMLSEAELEGMDGAQEKLTVNKAAVDYEGNLYIKTADSIWLFRAGGQCVGQVEVPAEDMIDIGVSKEGKVYVTYYANGIEVILSEISFDNCRLEGNAVIPGNGQLFTGSTRGLLLFDSAYLYEYDTDTNSYSVPMDWVEHYVNTGTIQRVLKKADGSILAVVWNCGVQDTTGQPVELLRCMETTREEKLAAEGEKQELVLYSPNGANPSLQEVVVNFNKQSETYKVILEECEYTDTEEFSMAVNARLSGKNSPDLLAINYNYYNMYQDAGILEDLTPYLAKSECLDEEGYLEPVLKPFREGEVLYAIPKNFTLLALATGKEQAKSLQKGEGFSTERFVSYLEENEDVKFEWNGYSLGILKYCMQYGMDSFVDFEKGICNFNSDEFRSLVLRLEDMRFESDFYDSGVWNEIVESGEKIFTEVVISDFYSLEKMKIMYNREMRILGYPTTTGEMKTQLRPTAIMGILKNSQGKQGAWEFLEYYMLNYNVPEGFPTDRKSFEEEKTWAQKKTKEPHARVFAGNESINIYEVGKEQIEQIMEAIECAKPPIQEEEVISEILKEELTYYINKDKSLDETLDIIQNRAQLYLNENK